MRYVSIMYCKSLKMELILVAPFLDYIVKFHYLLLEPFELKVSCSVLREGCININITYLNKIYDWFEERLEIQSIADDITSKYVPPHVNIFYCLGGITLTCFLIQVATGFAMTFYYRPTVAEAFASVQYIMTDVNFGWLIRSIHRWSASMMVLMMILHVFRVYLTGGFKKPRELTWVTGVILGVLTVSFGVTGYSLPWDQIGYWAVKIVTGVPDAIPVIGGPVVELLRGSVSVGQSTLTRFYSLHTFVLPLLTAVFMLMHFLMIRKQGISGPL
jgi:cytochrome b6